MSIIKAGECVVVQSQFRLADEKLEHRHHAWSHMIGKRVKVVSLLSEFNRVVISIVLLEIVALLPLAFIVEYLCGH